MNRRTTVRSKAGLVAVVVAALIVGMTGAALAALPAPTWIPGQPILAGAQMIAMWLPVPGATKYNIYVDGVKLTESPANQYLGPAPDKAGRHAITVSAVDASGAEGPQSSPGYITIVKIEPPPKPFFRSNAEEQSVLLRWNSVQGAMIYNVYKSTAKDGPYNLITSTQEETFSDTGLEYDKTLFYAITAKDAGGKESDRSVPAEVLIEKPKVAAKKKQFQLSIVPTTQVRLVSRFGDFPVGTLSRYKKGPMGDYYALYRSDLIRVVDQNMNVVQNITIPKPENLNPLQLWNLSFVDDDTALICDLGNFAVHLVDVGRGQILSTYTSRKPTQEQNEKVYNALSDRFKTARLQPLSATMLDDGSIWIADGDGGIIHHLDEDGEIIEWHAFYMAGEGENAVEKRLSGIPDMMTLDGGDVVVFSDRFAVRLDPATMTSRWVAGEAATMVGNFIGFGGMSLIDDKRLVIADPTMHTVQVFDVASGDYIFSMGGPQKRPDPQQETRALVDYVAPFYPHVNEQGQFVVFLGYDKNFLVRSIDEAMPAQAAAVAPE